jgi:hypothetical protein
MTSTTDFCKNETCPSSHELLGYQCGDLAGPLGREIRRHVSACDFCAAEIDFYSHYPQAEGPAPAAPIPAPLLELAEALLKNRTGGSTSLDKLLSQNGRLSLG